MAKELETSFTTGVAPDSTAVHRIVELTNFRKSCNEVKHVFQEMICERMGSLSQ